MRLDFFHERDSVLLVGEGNFSFAVALHKHQFSIDITATSFQSEPKSADEQQNVEYLKTNEVRVFFNVDATKLQDNANLAGTKFSKIIFNFPHVGGKMKIHLNRELLKRFFQSTGHVLSEKGLVLVSLCQGQGGTPADRRQRRWDDTWQITEMAAHGDFVLTNIEPFHGENFPGYECVGYRSQNVAFHLDGALVHVFSRKPLFEDIHRLEFIPLPGTDILTHSIYADLYIRNPILNPDSAVSYFQKILIDCLTEHEVEIIQTMPLYIPKEDGVHCEVNSTIYSLRSDPTEIFSALHNLSYCRKRFIFYPGMYFRKLGSDFLTNSLIDFKFTLFGKTVRSEVIKYLHTLIPMFKKECTVIFDDNAIMYKNGKTGNEVNVAEFHDFLNMEFCIINAQTICEYLFDVKWRDIWTDHKISNDDIPKLKAVLLYPSQYELDITLRYRKPFSDEELMRVLWLGGGLIIEAVKLVNEYSCDKWSSKCYRITYRSLDRAMYRERVIRIHAMIGRSSEMNLFKRLLSGGYRNYGIVQVRWLSDGEPIALKPRKPKAKGVSDSRFVDRTPVEAHGGKGGDGCISFLRLCMKDRAGPDGGDGGNGGHVIFKASANIRDLYHLQKVIKAPDGERGFNRDCTGRNGKHEFVKVPVGTLIKNQNGVIVGDLSTDGAMFLAARGGAGGRGNHYFTSDTIQSPEVAEFGAEGEKIRYHLELKTVAHVGLVGMPNAGKSTLLRAISRARPKVAAYAFTTLSPNIGIVNYSDYEQVAVADLPGLVEGSHKNEGLGIEFLRHAERCRGILFVIDLSSEDPTWQYETLRYEMSQFSDELLSRPYAVVGNKIDLKSAQDNLEKFKSNVDCPVIAISAKMGKNLPKLLKQIRILYDSYMEESEDEMNG